MASDDKKSVLVTGAAGGMGQAVCRRLIEKGWNVVGLDHNKARLDVLARELADKSFTPLIGELSNPDLYALLTQELGEGFQVNGLVNLAGVSLGDPLDSLTKIDWDKSFAVNVTAPMILSKWAAPRMKRTGGSIVNVASPVALVGARKPSYSASKAALIGLTMSLARDLGKHSIRVNALFPGATITHMTKDWDDNKRRAIADANFLKRLCEPREISAVIDFLLSDDASFITGTTIDMTAGGMFGH